MTDTSTSAAKLLFKDREDFRSLHQGAGAAFIVVVALYAAAALSLFCVRSVAEASWIIRALVYVPAFCIIGWAQYSIGNGMHEAVHHNLGNKNTDLWASLLTAFPIGLTMSYRDVHLAHHRYLGTDRDPEFGLYSTFPKSKVSMLRRFAWFVSGFPAALQFLGQQSSAGTKSGKGGLLIFAIVQLAIAACFYFAFGNALYYVAFWAAPIATIGKLLSSTRLMCEHGSPTREWVVRTIAGPRWQTWVLGAFDFNFHGEHHLMPSVPYAGLEELHRRHKSCITANPGYRPFEGRFELFEGGYAGLVAKWFGELPWK